MLDKFERGGLVAEARIGQREICKDLEVIIGLLFAERF